MYLKPTWVAALEILREEEKREGRSTLMTQNRIGVGIRKRLGDGKISRPDNTGRMACEALYRRGLARRGSFSDDLWGLTDKGREELIRRAS